jgi:hypothetical protein
MSIEWQFEWFTTDGGPFISLQDWIKTLSAEEQIEFYDADRRQKSNRQEKINEGNLIVDGSNYIWKDEQAETVNKENDPIWSEYWVRWQIETTSSCRMIRKEI